MPWGLPSRAGDREDPRDERGGQTHNVDQRAGEDAHLAGFDQLAEELVPHGRGDGAPYEQDEGYDQPDDG
jgi:hypothetical protein